MLIIGAVIGAGFITGREIYSFFLRNNISPFLVFIFCFILFHFVFSLLLKSDGKKLKLLERHQPVFNVILIVCYFIFVAAMLAGMHSFQQVMFSSLKFPVISIISAMLAVLVVLGGVEKISVISTFLIPFIFLFIIIISILNIETIFLKGDINHALFLSPFLYVGFNVCFLAGALEEKGKTLTKKQSKLVAIISSCILSVCVFLIMNVLLNNPNYLNSDMPLLTIAKDSGKLLLIFAYLVCIIGIFTTLIAALYATQNLLKKPTIYSLCIVVVSAFFASLVGFKFIVDYLYQISGALASLYLFLVIIGKVKK